MNSKENIRKILQSLGIALSIIGAYGNNNGLLIIGGALSIIGTILMI